MPFSNLPTDRHFSSGNLSSYQNYIVDVISHIKIAPYDETVSLFSAALSLPPKTVQYILNTLRERSYITIDEQENLVLLGSKNTLVNMDTNNLIASNFTCHYLKDKDEVLTMNYGNDGMYYIHGNREFYCVLIRPGEYTSFRGRIAAFNREYAHQLNIHKNDLVKTRKSCDSYVYVLCPKIPEMIECVENDLASFNPHFSYKVLYYSPINKPNRYLFQDRNKIQKP